MTGTFLPTRGHYALLSLEEEALEGKPFADDRDRERAWMRVRESLSESAGPYHEEARPAAKLKSIMYDALQRAVSQTENAEVEARDLLYWTLQVLGEIELDDSGDTHGVGTLENRINNWLDRYGRDHLKEGRTRDGEVKG